MKRKTKFIIFAGLLSVISLVGCLVNEEPPEQVEKKDVADITVEEAKEYFNSNVITFHLSPPGTTRTVDDELVSTPMWEKAMALNFEGRRIIDIPVDAPFASIRKLENPSDSISLKNKGINTITRLIAEKDVDDKILFTIVRITGENQYVLRHRKKFLKMRVNSIDEFSGMIKYYTLQGELIFGKKYESGNVIATITPVDTGTSKAQTRAMMEEQCDFVYYQIDEYYCQDVYVGGELLDHSCNLANSWTETVWECRMVEIPDPDICLICGQNPCQCSESELEGLTKAPCDKAQELSLNVEFTSRINDLYKKTYPHKAGNTEQGFIYTSTGEVIYPAITSMGHVSFTNTQVTGTEFLEWYHSHPGGGGAIPSLGDLKALSIRYQQGYIKSDEFTYGVVSQYGCLSIMITSPEDFAIFAEKIRNKEFENEWKNDIDNGKSVPSFETKIQEVMTFFDVHKAGLSIMFRPMQDEDINNNFENWKAKDLDENNKLTDKDCK